MKSNLLMFESKKPIFIIIFYQRMKVSPEARRLSKYKKKKKEFSVATLQFDVTFLYANTMRAVSAILLTCFKL